jgi:hypothetical protein
VVHVAVPTGGEDGDVAGVGLELTVMMLRAMMPCRRRPRR